MGKETFLSGQNWQTYLCTFSFVGLLFLVTYVHQFSLKMVTANWVIKFMGQMKS